MMRAGGITGKDIAAIIHSLSFGLELLEVGSGREQGTFVTGNRKQGLGNRSGLCYSERRDAKFTK